MPARTIVVELNESLSAYVDRQVATGTYATASEVIETALDARRLDDLFASAPPISDEALAASLREAVAEYEADPDSGVELDEAFDSLEANGRPRVAVEAPPGRSSAERDTGRRRHQPLAGARGELQNGPRLCRPSEIFPGRLARLG